MLDWLLQDGRIVLLAIAILVAEIGFFRLVPPAARAGFLANAAAGLALLGALYSALNGLNATVIAACLGVGLIAHLAYLATLAGKR